MRRNSGGSEDQAEIADERAIAAPAPALTVTHSNMKTIQKPATSTTLPGGNIQARRLI